VKINHRTTDIQAIEIDPTLRMADIERRNNMIDISQGLKPYESSTK
jgi:hypothetical protein